MRKVNEYSNFQEFQGKISDQYTLKKADSEMFSFWVNCSVAKKQRCMNFLGCINLFRKAAVKQKCSTHVIWSNGAEFKIGH